MQHDPTTIYGLKYNPFASDIPAQALVMFPDIDSFLMRIEHYKRRQGGFSLLSGPSGSGKSSTLRLLQSRLSAVRDVTCATIEHPQSSLSDFYRELGDQFDVPLRLNNRWHSFKTLRQRFSAHFDSNMSRPILLIDEAQEMSPAVLAELRLLSSVCFDSQTLLTVILAADDRFSVLLERPDLLPLKSRLSPILMLKPRSAEALQTYLETLLSDAGNPALMTSSVRRTLCEHAMGNLRSLMHLCNELLMFALSHEAKQLDEQLFFELYTPKDPPSNVGIPRRKSKNNAMLTV